MTTPCEGESLEKYAMVNRVKSTAMLLFKYSVNRYGLGLSNELLFFIIAQGAEKL